MTDQISYWTLLNSLQSRPSEAERAVLARHLRQIRRTIISEQSKLLLRDLVVSNEEGLPWRVWWFFNHFNVLANKGHIAVVLHDYLQTAIERNAGASFGSLLQAVATHPAMLLYLDNVRNVKGQGNENQARELLELHTLGVGGGYTQADVTQVAEIMTGWGVRLRGETESLGQTEFNLVQHESGDKRVMGRVIPATGARELPELLAFLAAHPMTAQHLSRRLCIWVLGDDPPAEAVSKLVSTYQRTEGSISALWDEAHRMRQVLRGKSKDSFAFLKFKDPLRYVTSAVRLLVDGERVEDVGPMERWLRQLGQPLLLRASPDGYPLKGVDWLDAGQLTSRVELAHEMVVTVPRMVTSDRVSHIVQQHPLETPVGRPWASRLGERSRKALERVRQPADAWALLLASPEFMYV
jgi:uncharacterized protein (DUF1800 family)